MSRKKLGRQKAKKFATRVWNFVWPYIIIAAILFVLVIPPVSTTTFTGGSIANRPFVIEMVPPYYPISLQIQSPVNFVFDAVNLAVNIEFYWYGQRPPVQVYFSVPFEVTSYQELYNGTFVLKPTPSRNPGSWVFGVQTYSNDVDIRLGTRDLISHKLWTDTLTLSFGQAFEIPEFPLNASVPVFRTNSSISTVVWFPGDENVDLSSTFPTPQDVNPSVGAGSTFASWMLSFQSFPSIQLTLETHGFTRLPLASEISTTVIPILASIIVAYRIGSFRKKKPRSEGPYSRFN